MNLEYKFNKLLNRHPSLFQFNKKFEVVEVKESNEISKVEFKLFNSKRKYSYPFYKPISKILTNVK